MRKVTVSERARYVFDNTVSRGPLALVGWLFLVTTAMVLLGTLFVYLLGLAPAVDGRRPGFTETLWLDLMRTIDPGNIGGDAGDWPYLLTMLAITAGGILIFTTPIGVVNQGITDKVSDLRKGRSFVVERDHTVILGWSSQVFTIVEELAVANESRGAGAVIAILADRDKVEMEDEIRTRTDTKNTRVVCRTLR
ncbi:hypothetical protein [Rubrobacter indicoceani]|uniref:hypothetical protein n=1 Tax=Rubrobacter indicoceani TaxID=2051957 RepID=UPI0019699C2C|nr:hypothetical protein [Rubrobacter indicoceani]